MKYKTLQFGTGFKVLVGNRGAQAAQMVLQPVDTEGDAGNKHQGTDRWLFVVTGTGRATIGTKKSLLRPNTLLLIEQNEKHEIRCAGRTPVKTLNSIRHRLTRRATQRARARAGRRSA